MFVVTVKFNKKTAVAILLALAVVLAAIVIIAARGTDGGSAALRIGGGIKTNEDRVEYLRKLGYEVESEPISEQSIVIPKEFDDIFKEYNLLQKKQGYDLSLLKGLEAKLYTYRVTNYPNTSDEVLAELFIRNGQVIGGDIHSTALDGFMHGLK